MSTTFAPADLALLDALDRTRLVRLGAVIEAEVQARDGSTYRCRLDGAAWACSCPAAVYAGRSADPCKHARALGLIRSTLPETLGGTAQPHHHHSEGEPS